MSCDGGLEHRGYLAGSAHPLRGAHSREVFFRDTAQGSWRGICNLAECSVAKFGRQYHRRGNYGVVSRLLASIRNLLSGTVDALLRGDRRAPDAAASTASRDESDPILRARCRAAATSRWGSAYVAESWGTRRHQRTARSNA